MSAYSAGPRGRPGPLCVGDLSGQPASDSREGHSDEGALLGVHLFDEGVQRRSIGFGHTPNSCRRVPQRADVGETRATGYATRVVTSPLFAVSPSRQRIAGINVWANTALAAFSLVPTNS